MTEIIFGSDNQGGVSPEILEAMARCNAGTAVAYGDDDYSRQLNVAFSEIFERDAFVFATSTGTAANALALSAITPPYGETVCHEAAHIVTTEGGAPEFYAGGSRMFGIPGHDGKIAPSDLQAVLDDRMRPSRHHYACSSLSITQSTEVGTIYSLDELSALSEIAHAHGLRVQMDGARFTNALVALEASPAEMSWRAGIDVLSFGTTKNGTMNAEVVVTFDPEMARDLGFRQKRAGLLISKMRFVSAQLLAFLQDDLWLRNARRANATAKALASVLERTPGVRLAYPVQTNQIFADIDPGVTAILEKSGFRFRAWDYRRPTWHRIMTSFEHDEASVDRVRQALASVLIDEEVARDRFAVR
ncbi:threonine aldolase family protein [Sinorhizobium meliloti]|uniref:threonine aldolase family protein n=1 Tax=Rhizobium meliloti TaxID=382 RepID=UPI003D656C11